MDTRTCGVEDVQRIIPIITTCSLRNTPRYPDIPNISKLGNIIGSRDLIISKILGFQNLQAPRFPISGIEEMILGMDEPKYHL